MIEDLHARIAPVTALDAFNDQDVLARLHVIESDIVMVSGSLVDGSGTPSSDFDFSVIAVEEDGRFHRETFPREHHMRFYTNGDRVKASFDYLPGGLLGVDVEYWTVKEVGDMLDRHARLYQRMIGRARKSSSFGAYGIDFRLLSRLTYGEPLQNSAEFEKLTARVRPTEIAFTAFATAVGSYPDFRDLVGMWCQSDFELTLLAARKMGIDTFRGLTHLHGNTNRNPKYLPRFLERLPERLQPLTTRFRELNSYGVGSPEAARDGVLRWLDLIDLAYGEIRDARDAMESVPTAAAFLDLLRDELHESMAWSAELSNEYCFRAREAVDGLPSLREMLAAMARRDAVAHHLPLRTWAASRSAPMGENNGA